MIRMNGVLFMLRASLELEGNKPSEFGHVDEDGIRTDCRFDDVNTLGGRELRLGVS